MDKTISFRVWYQNRMYHVLSVDNRDVWEDNGKMCGEYGCWYQRGQSSGDGWWIYVKPEDVMQYIGIRDRKNIHIYEGDIVDICRHSDEKNIIRVEIKDIRNLPQELFGSNFTWCEVVGNKYEIKN